MLPVNNEKKSNHSWSVWDTGKSLLAAAATVGSAYFGLRYVLSFWQVDVTQFDRLPSNNFANDASVDAGLSESISPFPHRRVASRHLLSVNATVINPIPDLQAEATVDYLYRFDADTIFSGDVDSIGIRNAQSMSPWLECDYVKTATYVTSGTARDVYVSGDIAFVADNTSGLSIFNVSSPSNPSLIGTYDTPGNALSVIVQGNTAYVADFTSGLQIIDVSVPASPVLLGNYDTTPGAAVGLDVIGNTAYVADGTQGLQIIDVSNPAAPGFLGSHPTPVLSTQVNVEGNIAYVVDSSPSLSLIDVSNPGATVLLGTYVPAGTASDVLTTANTTYLAAATQGVLVLDVSNPASPSLIGSYDTPGLASGLFKKGSLLFIADDSSGLQVLDLSTPASPTLLCSQSGTGLAADVFVLGNIAYVAADAFGLVMVDLKLAEFTGVPTASRVGEQYALELVGYNNQGDEAVSDNFLLTVNQLPKRQDTSLSDQSINIGDTWLRLLDSDALFKDPDNAFLRLSLTIDGSPDLPSWLSLILTPIFVGSYDTPGVARSVFVSGDVAYVADDTAGLQIIDVQDSAIPVLLNTFPTANVAFDVHVDGTMAYVADGTTGLQIVDVGTPASPMLEGNYNTPDDAFGVFVTNNIAYVADDITGVLLVNVTDTANPALLGSYDTPSNARAVFVENNLAYVSDSGAGFRILDVSDPMNPISIGTHPTSLAWHVDVRDEIAYVAVNVDGLQIYDVSVPATPTLLGSYSPPASFTYDVDVEGTVAFTVASSALRAIDVSNSSNPVLMNEFDGLSGNPRDVFVINHEAYVADGAEGMKIIDISQWELKAVPTQADAGNYKLELTATDVLGGAISDNFVLRVEGPPVFNSSIPDQAINVGEAYSYFIPQGVVSDPNADTITFSAALDSGANLPSWLSFSPFSATFAGVPPSKEQLAIRVTATDNIAGSTSESFNLDITYRPQVEQPIPDPPAWREGKSFNFTIPANAFVDLDQTPLIYSASRTNNLPLPAWLSFDANTGTFSGTPPIDSAGKLTLVVTATDSVTGSTISQNFDLLVVSNLAPRVANPISSQVASVGEQFTFVLSDTTFIDPNGDPLTYAVSSSLPKWLHFFSESQTFTGKPGRGDTGTYADKVVGVQVTASDGELSRSTEFNINVKGVSHLELAIKIGAPMFTCLSLLVACYAGRAFFLNRKNKSKYQKLKQEIVVGESNIVIPLSSDSDRVAKVQAKLLKPEPRNCCGKLTGFFKSPRRTFPSGKLPHWLAYNAKNNTLNVVGDGPSERYVGQILIQVKDSAGVTLEEFPLVIKPADEFAAEAENAVDMQDIGVGTSIVNPAFTGVALPPPLPLTTPDKTASGFSSGESDDDFDSVEKPVSAVAVVAM